MNDVTKQELKKLIVILKKLNFTAEEIIEIILIIES